MSERAPYEHTLSAPRTYSLGQHVAVDLGVLVHLARNHRHRRVQAHGLLDRGFGVLEVRECVGRALVRAGERLADLLDHLLLDLGMRRDQVQRPQETGARRVMALKLHA